MEIPEKHLDAVATRMGGFLRGFNDPRIHSGSAAGFNAEFRNVMAWPALHLPGEKRTISYSEAAASLLAPAVTADIYEAADPVGTMIRGLCEVPDSAAALRRVFPPATLQNDLAMLLRRPALLYYLSITDREAFFARLAGIARKDSFPLVTGEGQVQGSGSSCPACGSALPPPRQGEALKCGSCGLAIESVRTLPVVSGVVALVSFEMLRRIVALDLVDSYQEEGKIVPLKRRSKMP